jgi:hypothetical protein
MLVHPSQRTVQHLEYRLWIGNVFDEWQRILELSETDQDHIDLVDDFREAYNDLIQTVTEPTFL